MIELWTIVMDGRPIYTGLPRVQAERLAARLAQGVLAKRGGTTIRAEEIDIRRDHAAHEAREASYRQYKESR